MKTQDLAAHVLRLIHEKKMANMELSSDDVEVLSDISVSFPDIKQDGDDTAFYKWIWDVIVEGEETVAPLIEEVKKLEDDLRHKYETGEYINPDEVEEKKNGLSRIKHRVYDRIRNDKELMVSLKRKWESLTNH